MADAKLSDLTALAGADLAVGDLFYVVDVDAGATGSKKMTAAEKAIGLFKTVVCPVLFKSADGINFDTADGGDSDIDLLTVDVTGTPKLWWDESEDSFSLTKPVVATGVMAVGVKASNSGTTGTVDGIQSYIASSGSGAITAINGLNVQPYHGSSGTLTSLRCLYATPTIVGNCTSSYGVYVSDCVAGGGTLSNQYGVFVSAMSRGDVNYAVYTQGATRSRFGGPVALLNATATVSLVADTCEIYATDQAAGNSCLHIKTENGSVLKMFQGAAIANPGAGEAEAKLIELLAHLRLMGIIAT